MEQLTQFREAFEKLTGNQPFPWQEDLYGEWFCKGKFPSLCNLPTGLGKTSVVAIWLIALANHPEKIPRRLVYVVNRRTVVDQTTIEVERLRANLPTTSLFGDDWRLAISTLRGQFADNREWSADPSRPAVICGTVDMIGSRLLFSGYGVGFKSRPLHAGFLGQDALIVHDEAHLEPAFQRLITSIYREQGRCNDFAPCRVMELTATTRSANGQPEGDGDSKQEPPFELTTAEKNPPEVVPEPADNEPPIHTVWRRFKARKRLHLKQAADDTKIAEEIAKLALQLRKDEQGNDANAAVVIFMRTVDEVTRVCEGLTNEKEGVSRGSVQQLTGTMRGLERDALAERDPVFMRFLPGKRRNPSVTPVPGTVFLVCTSAGEVGINISADHTVCDLSTFESTSQRFGRVNRYGLRTDTRITVVYPAEFDDKDKLTPAREATLKLLQRLNGDASPKALGELMALLTEKQREAAFAPRPTIPTATDILFDAWALTSITQPMPGRPEVAPYLHGIAKDLPQTTIAWRAELDLLKDDPDAKAVLSAIFSKHRIRPHESLIVNSFHLVEFLKEITAPKERPDLLDTRVALIFSRGLGLTTVKTLIDDPRPLNADPTLVLPASFGGLDKNGMLGIRKPKEKKPASSEATGGHPAVGSARSEVEPVQSLDIADKEGYERDPPAKARRRLLINRSGEGWTAHALPGTAPLPPDWKLDGLQDTPTRLVKHLENKSSLKIRLVRPVKLDEEGDPVCLLVCLSPPPKGRAAIEQALEDHVPSVEREAEGLARVLLPGDGAASAALRFAAKWHDEGKKSKRWQRYIGRRNESDPPLGKAAEWRDPKLLAGYRHEFGSLLRIADDEARRYFADAALNLTSDAQRHALELALHLIAAHHGYGDRISPTRGTTSPPPPRVSKCTSKSSGALLGCNAVSAGGAWRTSNPCYAPPTGPPVAPPAAIPRLTMTPPNPRGTKHERRKTQHHRGRGRDQPRPVLRLLRAAGTGRPSLAGSGGCRRLRRATL